MINDIVEGILRWYFDFAASWRAKKSSEAPVILSHPKGATIKPFDQEVTQDLRRQFERSVIEAFEFLEREYGFSKGVMRPDENCSFVVYENSSIFVRLFHGPEDF